MLLKKKIAFGLIIFIGFLFFVYHFYNSPRVSEYNYITIYLEGGITLVVLVGLFGSMSKIEEFRLCLPMSGGLMIVFFGMLDDIADEFFIINDGFNILNFELFLPIGFMIALFGVFRYIHLMNEGKIHKRDNKELLRLNEELKKAYVKIENKQKEIEKKNEKLEELMDIAYTMKFGGELTQKDKDFKRRVKKKRKR